MADQQDRAVVPGIEPTTPLTTDPTAGEALRPAPSAAGPDWDHHAEDVLCPLCEYNLRGLIEPRCPECGYRFEWPDLLDPRRRLHPYLFEHHPEKNFRSFWRTATGGWRPREFWTALHPIQPSRPRRLIAYWLIAASFVVLAYAATFIGAVVRSAAASEAQQQQFLLAFSGSGRSASQRAALINLYGSIESAAEAEYPSDYLTHAQRLIGSGGRPLACVFPAMALFAWPWLTLIPLLIFRWSMRRAKIGLVHVLRCLLYSSDLLIWYGLLLLALAPFIAQPWVPAPSLGPSVMPLKPILNGWNLRDMGIAIGIVALGIAIYRLSVAYRCYLRFDHSVATVLASQLIVALAILNAVLAYRVWL